VKRPAPSTWRSARVPLWAAALLVPAAAVAHPSGVPGGAALRDAVRAWRVTNDAAVVRGMAELLAIPNVATDAPNIARNAEHILRLLERRGAKGRLLDGEGGPPVVYAELTAPGARRTVVVYAHYDGQPVDPARWSSPPWTPVMRTAPLEEGGREVPLDGLRAGETGPEWRLYARSAGDDKAPVIAALAAIDALEANGVPRSVNLKFFLEGEEEQGSPHLGKVLARNAELLKSDGWLLCDGPVHQTRRMQVYFGARGVTGVELTAYGPLRPLHSGHYGNWAPNPAVQLAHLVAGLRDRDGRILVPGYYDDVRPLSPAERAAVAAVPRVDEALRDSFALHATEAGGALLVERIMLPALNVRGLQSGAVGDRASNAIPSKATVSMDFRLVPDQTPETVRSRVEAHLRGQGFVLVDHEPSAQERRRTANLLRVRWEPGYPAARTPLDLPFSRAVVGALEEVLGAPVVRMPSLGGSIPMHLFAQATGRPIVGLPIVNHDNNQHAADENLRLQNLWDGIEAFAAIIARLGPLLDEAAHHHPEAAR
jgi:acetylornithine deacetylase/succinyl-diaminopimelate desuccinylase-like protein